MSGSDIRQRTGFRIAVLILLGCFCLAAFLFSMRCGSLNLSCISILEKLLAADGSTEWLILYHIRLPRVLLGGLVGAALALSGAILQGVMRNPLAAPGIIGVSSGGALTAVGILLLLPQFSELLVPAAFLGALATAVLVYALAWKGGIQPVRLILSGVAVASMLSALVSMLLLFNSERAVVVLDFMIGSLSAKSWTQVRLIWPYIVCGAFASFLLARSLNILALGDEVAAGLGLRVELMRVILLALSALLAAASVSVVGLLGFVGLIAPHVVRLMIGSDCRYLLPGAALFGAGMLVCCDTVGRIAMDPVELPAGIILALLGPPFFLYLLRRSADHEA